MQLGVSSRGSSYSFARLDCSHRPAFWVSRFDEGFIVTGAMLVLSGKLPYVDFSQLDGPAEYHFTAGLFALFGEKLIVVHIAHAMLLAGLAVTVFELSRVASEGHRTVLRSRFSPMLASRSTPSPASDTRQFRRH